MIFKKLSFAVIAFLMMLSSCDNSNLDDSIKLSDMKLNDFPLTEVSYLNIEITHPEIKDNTEKKYGEIKITIPYPTTDSPVSLKSLGLDKTKYDIMPAVGEQFSFSHTYTVFSKIHDDKQVHYNVTVVYEGESSTENAELNSFKFEKEKNPNLTETIEPFRIENYESTFVNEKIIYMMVPPGTDFSKLTPTIQYDAATIRYTQEQDHINFKLYPKDGMEVDFKYPKHFIIQLQNYSRTTVSEYEIIVDVKNPMEFLSPVIVMPNVKKGAIQGTGFTLEASWTNRGNHPIRSLHPISYTQKAFPFTDYTKDIIEATLYGADLTDTQPGEQGDIRVFFNTSDHEVSTGTYSTTAVFTPNFDVDQNIIASWPVGDHVRDVYATQSVTIQATVEE